METFLRLRSAFPVQNKANIEYDNAEKKATSDVLY